MPREKRSTPKDEALSAIATARGIVNNGHMANIWRVQVDSLLLHAIEQVEQLSVVRRSKKSNNKDEPGQSTICPRFRVGANEEDAGNA